MGLIFHYILTDGLNTVVSCQVFTRNGPDLVYDVEYNWTNFDKLKDCADKFLARSLIKAAIKKIPEERSNINEILNDIYFWEPEMMLTFLRDVSPQTLPKEKYSEKVRDAYGNHNCAVAFNSNIDWMKQIPKEIQRKVCKSVEEEPFESFIRVVGNTVSF